MSNVTRMNDRRTAPDDSADLQADIEDARSRLSATVDELGHRLDVRSRVRDAAHDTSQRASETASKVGHRASESAHGAAERVNAIGQSRPGTLVVAGLALAALAVGLLIGRRRLSG